MGTKRVVTLLDSVDITATANGTAQALPGNYQRWVVTTAIAAVTGTTPTLDVTVQHSADGTNWVTLTAVTQRTDSHANTLLHTFAAQDDDYLRPLLPYVRAIYTIGGTDTPTFNDVTVKIIVE